jgi:propionyl-CoA carboxylase beta chain
VPQISLIMGPCAGGAVYSPAITDFTIMVDQTRATCSSPAPRWSRRSRHEDVDFEQLGGAIGRTTRTIGRRHFAGRRRPARCLASVRDLLSFLPSNNPRKRAGVEPLDDP